MSRAPIGDVLRTCVHTDPIGTEAEVEALAQRIYRLACPGGLPLIVRWSDAATRSFGTAGYYEARRCAVFMISRAIWNAAPESERRELIAHEMAHLVVFVDHAALAKPRPRIETAHGHRWRVAMTRFGYPYGASSKHKIHVPSKRADSLEIKCACSQHSITLDRVARANMETWCCRRCHKPYAFVAPHGRTAWMLRRGQLQTACNPLAHELHPEAALWHRVVTRSPGIVGAPSRVLVHVAERVHAELAAPAIAACTKETP